MIILDLIQGSKEWLEARSMYHTASEAPAMMGVSKYTSRSELLKQKATGVTPEVSEYQQRIFDKGHAAEAMARPIAEGIVGEPLYPISATDNDGYLLASFDGATLLSDIIWEHKIANEKLRTATVDTLPEQYKIQMDQQLLVSGAEKCLFMASDGTEDDCNWFWYESTPERFEALMSGWKQLEADRNAYVSSPEVVAPVGRDIGSFPALRVEISGEVRASNLAEFESAAMSLIDSVKTELVTDQDFADAEKAVKSFDKAEKELKAKKQQALEQTASIDELFKTVDRIGELMRDKRLLLTRTVKAEKENRKAQIVQNAKRAYRDWLDAQDSPIDIGDADFNPAEAMKGKKTISSLQSAADDALAAAKIAATQQIELYKSNLKIIDTRIVDYPFLFSDWAQLITKQQDDMRATISDRVVQHERHEAERLEFERQRIQAEKELEAGVELSRTEEETSSIAKAIIDELVADRSVMVTIEHKEYAYLLKAAEKLHRLEAWGVNEWDYYSEAMADIDD